MSESAFASSNRPEAVDAAAVAPAPVGARLAVLGKPIHHSKSPALHRAAYAALGLGWSYELAEVDEAGLAAYVESRGPEWRGLSLTMPLKQTVQPLLDGIDEVGALTGAVNTLLWAGERPGASTREAQGRRLGFNTDVPGIVRALAAAGFGFGAQAGGRERVHVLGGGATAASALVAAAGAGAASALLSVRTPERAEGLRPLAQAVGIHLDIAAFDAPRDDEATALVISTLPGTVTAPIEFAAGFRAMTPLFDVAYDPWPAPLAAQWLEAGGEVLSGLAMLAQQALLQVRIFLSGDPALPLPREGEVLAAMLAAVGLDASGR